jgi:NADH-quinone oxidoreductase subunit J
MALAFYIAGAVAILATLLALTRSSAVHGLLYLIVSLLAAAVMIYLLGAPFIAALEVIIYAGAIMVLFVFTVMMLNLGREGEVQEKALLSPASWVGAGTLAALLLGVFAFVLLEGPGMATVATAVPAKQVGIALYGPYLLAVELASILLLAALVGAFHLGWRGHTEEEESDELSSDRARAADRRDLIHAGDRGVSGAAQHPVRAPVD